MQADPPADTPTDARADTPTEPPADTRADTPTEPSADARAEPPVDARVDARADTPTEPPADARAEPPIEPPADTRAEPQANPLAAPTAGKARAPRGLLAVRVRPRRPALVAAVAVLAALGLAAVFAPWLTSLDPVATDMSATELPPGSPGHLLGTDQLGRDLLTRMLYGARTSLLVGLTAAAITVGLGMLLGGLAAVAPRWLDALIARTADVLLSLPLLVIVLAFAAVAGPSLGTVIVAIAVASWMPVALIVRAELRGRRERLYVRAAYGLGLSRWQVLRRHLLPGALPPVASVAAFEVGHAILAESTLSFLGLGIPPNHPSWGNLLTEAQSHLLTGAWYTVAIPAAAVVVTIIAVNVVAGAISGPSEEGGSW